MPTAATQTPKKAIQPVLHNSCFQQLIDRHGEEAADLIVESIDDIIYMFAFNANRIDITQEFHMSLVILKELKTLFNNHEMRRHLIKLDDIENPPIRTDVHGNLEPKDEDEDLESDFDKELEEEIEAELELEQIKQHQCKVASTHYSQTLKTKNKNEKPN